MENEKKSMNITAISGADMSFGDSNSPGNTSLAVGRSKMFAAGDQQRDAVPVKMGAMGTAALAKSERTPASPGALEMTARKGMTPSPAKPMMRS